MPRQHFGVEKKERNYPLDNLLDTGLGGQSFHPPREEGASPPGWLNRAPSPYITKKKKGRGAGRHPASTAPSRLHPGRAPPEGYNFWMRS